MSEWRIAHRLIVLALLAALAPLAPAGAEGTPSSYAVRAGRIMPVSRDQPWVIDDGVIIVRQGVIEAIGPAPEIDIPVDLPVIEFPHETITPGFVAASSNLTGSSSAEESISALYHASDEFDRYGDYRDTLASGVTTAHLSPGWNRLLSGHGAVVRLGGSADDRVLRDDADLTVTLHDSAYNPPELVKELYQPSPDHAIEPAQPQRPTSRLGQYLALKEAITAAISDDRSEFDPHLDALARAWNSDPMIRLQVHRAADVEGGINFFRTHERDAYLVGGIEAAEVAEAIRTAQLPLVYTIDATFRSPAGDIGFTVDPLVAEVEDLSSLHDIPLALAVYPNQPISDLRLAAVTALRGGIDERTALEAITRTPAEILGVSDRVGSLDIGKDADFLVLNGDPLDTSSHIRRVFVCGRPVYASAPGDQLLVKADTIWRGPDDWLDGGAVLVEDGKIVAVGKRVPTPPGCRIIDAGPGSFVAPGLIDAHGHLGLDQDRSSIGPEITLARLVGAPDVTDLRVARAGVTTVLMAPYDWQRNGSQVTAVKTGGRSRSDRVIRETTAIAFDVAGVDPREISRRLKPRLEAGKKYLEKWEKYEKDLAEWKEKKAKGELDDLKKKEEETPEETNVEPKADPVTGVWQVKLTGGPMPEAQDAKISLRLTGSRIEGRVIEPAEAQDVPHQILGTLSGSSITGTIEGEFGLPPEFPQPTWNAELDATDHMAGTAGIDGVITVNFDATRIDKSAQEFKAVRTRRTRGEDGQPLPPKVDESLEPIRALLEKKMAAFIRVSEPAEIEAVLDVLIDEYEVPVVLLNAEGARLHSDRLKEKNVGVVLPRSVMRHENYQPYHQGDDLSRNDVMVAFQSDAEDGARSLPLVGLYAVERGMSAEEALAAMTIDAAKMFKIDDRVGSIEPGKDADLVIFTGYPFDAGSSVKHVIVNGQEVKP